MSKAVLTIHPKWCELIASGKKVVSTIKFELEITGATLLTIEEAKQLPERLEKYDKYWWVRTLSYPSSMPETARIAYTVRPVLIISNLESSNLKIGDTFKFGGKDFEIISNNKAFCLSDIGQCAFRKDYKAPDANDYEKSDVKKYIDDWFEKAKESNDES